MGWSKVNFSTHNDCRQILDRVSNIYYSNGKTVPQVVGKKNNEIRRFKGIKAGDKVVVPYRGGICLAVAGDAALYSKTACNRDLANQHKVTYCRDSTGEIIFIPRDRLTGGFQTRLRVRGTTIADLAEFRGEIEDLFRGQDFDTTFNNKKVEFEEKFKRKLLKNIQSGNNNLEAGGYGLEKLIVELLKIDGYKAEIQSKKRFSGFADADIEAIKEDFLVRERLLVQVKHHSGTTGIWGAQQLLMILDSEKDLFSEYRLVLVTSASPSEELKKLCEDRNIILIDGEVLAEWIFKSLPQLAFDTKRVLSICDIPTLLN